MKKIMFNDKYGLTEAVLNGIKTQTRRVHHITTNKKTNRSLGVSKQQNPRYKIGEEVAVAMSYSNIYERVKGWEYREEYRYKHEYLAGWKNKMFVDTNMPYATIIITTINMERLQDISDEDCLKEGIVKKSDGYYIENVAICFTTPKEAYKYLINKICGNGTWDNNPYVWVYDFELCK